jgi:hypothetical protein
MSDNAKKTWIDPDFTVYSIPAVTAGTFVIGAGGDAVVYS